MKIPKLICFLCFCFAFVSFVSCKKQNSESASSVENLNIVKSDTSESIESTSSVEDLNIVESDTSESLESTSSVEDFDIVESDASESIDSLCCSEDSACTLVLNVPEILILGKYLEKVTNGKHGAAVAVFNPNEESEVYRLSVGLNGEERFETMYHFNVNKKTCEITIDEIVPDRNISLKEWQKENSDYFENLKKLTNE